MQLKQRKMYAHLLDKFKESLELQRFTGGIYLAESIQSTVSFKGL